MAKDESIRPPRRGRPKEKISWLQIVAWVLGLIAVGILVYGIIRELFLI